MKIPKKARREAKQLFRACMVQSLLDEGRVRSVARLVLERKPRSYLAVLSHFTRLVRLEIKRRQARVESAIPLAPALQASVQANLTRLYGEGLQVSFEPNTALIGGLRVQVGCDVYDGSVQSRLAELANRF